MLTEPRTAVVRRRWTPPDVAAIAPDVWLLIAITAMAGLLRFATLTHQSFWIDEATTVHEVGLPFGAMLHEIRINETTPPLYFALAWVWTRIFGAGELGIRSLSAVAGIALVPVAYLCGRELASRRAGVVTAALTAASPFMIWYSQEARSYMVFALMAALSFLYWARAIRTHASRDVAFWGVFSALAILTHFFAGFLVGPEAVWLLWRLRNRPVLFAVAGTAAVQLAVLPLAIGDTSHPLGWIAAFRLSARIQQTPVDFAVSQLYLSPSWLAGHGLVEAALAAGIVVGLLWFGRGTRERRAAASAATFAGFVILVPIALAELGHDYVFARNFMPAWIPLAVVLGAACTAPRARKTGAALALLVVAGFLWANFKINSSPAYERPDWRGAASALGAARGPRAIVAYDGNAAEQPLAIYLTGTRFSYTGAATPSPAVKVTELDIVGDTGQVIATPLPAGVRLISSTRVNDIFVVRFRLTPAWHLSTVAIVSRARELLIPAATGAAVLIQP